MSDDRQLSGEEKRAQLKEEYKKELQARREILDRVQQQRKTAGAEKALADLLGLTEANPLLGDDTDSWIQKLREGAATAEAKIDMVLERLSGEPSTAPTATPASPTATPTPAAEAPAPTPSADPRPVSKTLGDAVSATEQPVTDASATPAAESAPAPSPKKTLGDVLG